MQKNKWNKEERRITMTEELVTLETAKMLKEKGFNWKCEHLQLYLLSPYYGLEISQLHLSRFLYHFPVGISL